MSVIVREKKKGQWWIFINHNGKRKSKKIGDKRTANNLAKEIRERLAKGDMGMVKTECPTVAKYGREYLNLTVHEWTDRTITAYDMLFNNHIVPALGSMPLNEIKRKQVRNFLEDIKGRGLSSSTAGGALTILSSIFNRAVEDELVAVNPCIRMGRGYSRNNTKKKKNPLDTNEVQEFIENTSRLDITFGTLYLLKVRTGMRVGEILALEWKDIDLENRMVTVNKAYDYKNGTVKSTKTEETRRVRLTHLVVEKLKELRQATSGTGLVFSDAKGNHLNYYDVDKWFRKIVPGKRSLNDLRHTYATLRLAKGDNLVDVSKQLGHKDVTTTLKHYTDWIPLDNYVHQVDELDTLHLTAPQMHPTTEKPHGYN